MSDPSEELILPESPNPVWRDAATTLVTVMTARNYSDEKGRRLLLSQLGERMGILPPRYTNQDFEKRAQQLEELSQMSNQIPSSSFAPRALAQASKIFADLPLAPTQQTPFTECVAWISHGMFVGRGD